MNQDQAEFCVAATEAGQRIDKLIARHVDSIGRHAAAQLCQQGHVTQNGRRVKKSTLSEAGATIQVRLGFNGAAQAAPHISLDLVLSSDDWLIVNKPAGLPSAAVRGKERDTLAGALLAAFPELAGVGHGPADPGLIHRLDTYTSGLIVAARHQRAFELLKSALEKHQLTKRYLAIVPSQSLPVQGSCDLALAPHPKNERRVIAKIDGHPCHSEFRIVERGPHWDLVEVEVAAAYRHQVRAHLAALGAPLAGDTLYGSTFAEGAPRHALHATYVACNVAGIAPFEVTSPLPEDLRALLER